MKTSTSLFLSRIIYLKLIYENNYVIQQDIRTDVRETENV